MEKHFELPSVVYSDPNQMLREICNGDGSLYNSVNGMLGYVNGSSGDESMEELYDICMYKYCLNQKYKDAIDFEGFSAYVVNKLTSMGKK